MARTPGIVDDDRASRRDEQRGFLLAHRTRTQKGSLEIKKVLGPPSKTRPKTRLKMRSKARTTNRRGLASGVEVLAFHAFEDASGAVAKISWEGYAFLLGHPGEPRCDLVRSPPGGGTTTQAQVARGLCLHAFLVLLHEAADVVWRERNVQLNASNARPKY